MNRWLCRAPHRFSSREVHRYMCFVKGNGLLTFLSEKGSSFIKNVLCPKVVSASRGEVELCLPYKGDLIGNPLIPCLHGGVTAAMMEHAGGICAWTFADSKHFDITCADMRIDYLAPAPCEDIYVDAIVTHESGKFFRTDMTCWNHDKTKKIALGRGLFNVYRLGDDGLGSVAYQKFTQEESKNSSV